MVKAGNDIDAYCGKCKLTLAHVVIAVDGSRIARVQCKTCNGVHAFRDPTAKKKQAATQSSPRSKAASTRRTVKHPEAEYENLMTGTDLSRARRYRISESFGEGEVLDHKTFGLGRVTRVLGDDKFEVVFRVGSKILVHGRQANA